MPLDSTAASVRTVITHREVVTWLQTRVGSRSLAEDILLDAFVRGSHARESLSDDEPVVAWFFRVLRDAVVDYQWRHEITSHGLAAAAAELDSSDQPPGELRGAICQCLARLTDTVSPEYARVLRRVELEGVSVAEYAVEVGVRNYNLFIVQVFLAREALRKEVRRSCRTHVEQDAVAY